MTPTPLPCLHPPRAVLNDAIGALSSAGDARAAEEEALRKPYRLNLKKRLNKKHKEEVPAASSPPHPT